MLITGQKNGQMALFIKLINMRMDSDHGLTEKNLRKLSMMSKLIETINFKLMLFSCTSLFTAVYLLFAIIAYLRQDFPIPLISLVFWTIVMSIAGKEWSAIIVFTYSMVFYYTYYLSLRYRQLLQTLRLTPIIGFDQMVKVIIRKHVNLTKMTRDSNVFFSKIILVNHVISTITENLLCYIFLYGRGIIYFRLANACVAIFGFTLMLVITRVSATLSSDAHRFYNPVNSLNTQISCNTKDRLKVSLNIILSNS